MSKNDQVPSGTPSIVTYLRSGSRHAPRLDDLTAQERIERQMREDLDALDRVPDPDSPFTIEDRNGRDPRSVGSDRAVTAGFE